MKTICFSIVFCSGFQKPLIFIAFQWFLRAGTAETLKTNGFFGFLCSGIGKVLKNNGYFGFNGFSGLPHSAIDGLTALQPASARMTEG